jgi:AcrR family transcriptional regulator
MTTVDHRRAVADRNRAAILDAAERLLADHSALNMAALAAAAGVSRPTLYAHFKTIPDVLGATVERVVHRSTSAIEAAEPDRGSAHEALERMVEASWRQLASLQDLVSSAAEHLSRAQLDHAHGPLMSRTAEVMTRGQRDGTIRSDLPVVWLVSAYYALIHSADELARSRRVKRADALQILKTSLRDLLGAEL